KPGFNISQHLMSLSQGIIERQRLQGSLLHFKQPFAVVRTDSPAVNFRKIGVSHGKTRIKADSLLHALDCLLLFSVAQPAEIMPTLHECVPRLPILCALPLGLERCSGASRLVLRDVVTQKKTANGHQSAHPY